MTELKPCAHCGFPGWQSPTGFVRCSNNRCTAKGAIFAGVSHWNDRPRESTLEVRVRELEAKLEKLKNIDHFTPIEAAGTFVRKTLAGIAELNGIELDENAFAIQYFCPHCGQKSKSKEEMLTHDAECAMHPAVLKAERLETELAQAQTAASQWITYTGEPETLPMQGRRVLLTALWGEDHPVAILVYDAPDRWCTLGRSGLFSIPVKPGDRWAYLPVPPEAKI